MATSTPPATEPAAPDRRQRARLAALAVGVVALLAVAGVWFGAHQRAQAQGREDLEEALAALAPVATELQQMTDSSREALASTEGRLLDPAVGTTMATAIEDAEALDTSAPTEGSPAEQAAAVDRTREAAQDRLATLHDASVALFTDSYHFDLQQEADALAAATAGLDGAVATGEQALAAGTGDADARSALRSALDAAAAARATQVDAEDIDSVIGATTAVRDARTAVEAATGALAG
ncbi:hypothetical protein [Cellulomonas pakistanensis]|uniref:Uncharacterized protein n=1 Tax=Cellulomonas pakistanensis TaxID=992287 RepID=A0A919U627_9CELL|nr:hypothetical protein [Cellulomonas pakistanensis]GIG35845.1 hypothetical protein Cpa01nite_12260 [Cellulomonas pakistanensis]